MARKRRNDALVQRYIRLLSVHAQWNALRSGVFTVCTCDLCIAAEHKLEELKASRAG